MKRTIFFSILSIAAFLSIASCARPPLKEAGLLGENTIAAVRDIAAAYEQREIDAFLEKISLSFPGREELRKSVESVFSTYQIIRHRIQYTRMLVTSVYKGNIKATYTWEGEWQTAGGKIVKDGARVTLVFDPKTYKLLDIEGKNPFIPQSGELLGKQQ